MLKRIGWYTLKDEEANERISELHLNKNYVKKILGIAPKLEADGSYSPSKFALKMGVLI